jgi:asparagine synthase (glutamine-hydrolysing)
MIGLTPEAIPKIVSEASISLGTSDPIQLAYTIPVLVALKESREKLMLGGHGADELFGGYAKYSSAENPELMMSVDLEKMLVECSAIAKVATSLGKRIEFPFASPEMIACVKSVPLDKKVSASARKILLREVAELLDLRSQSHPKKAAQYSSGVLKEMKKLARTEGKSLSDWTRCLADGRERSS